MAEKRENALVAYPLTNLQRRVLLEGLRHMRISVDQGRVVLSAEQRIDFDQRVSELERLLK